MSVNLCDRCGDVTVDAERCHCAIAAARSNTGPVAVPDAPQRRAVPPGDDRPSSPPPRGRNLTVRLVSPLPKVMVAQVAGALEDTTASLLRAKVTAQFGRAVHVVIDLTGTSTLTRGGVRALLRMHREAISRGTQLHLTLPAVHADGTGRRLLDRLATDRLIRLAPSAESVLAGLSTGSRSTSATA